MRDIVIAAGALKGSLSAGAAAAAVERGLRQSGIAARLHRLLIADGGDGTLEAFTAAGGRREARLVFDPLGRLRTAEFGLLDDGTAVIEMAQASGLALLAEDELDAVRASTYGTGQLMKAALEAGARRMIIGMGGSASTDGGAGCLMALGVKLLDKRGRMIPLGGGGLRALAQVDASGLDARWREVELIIATDVDNPAVGERGAAAVFAPQKGASPEQIKRLAANLEHFFDVVETALGVEVRTQPGGGAAGAFAAGLMAFLGGRIRSGIDLLLDHRGFDDLLTDAGLVITSEGRLDAQTLGGKAPVGVARRAAARGVPTVALVGGLSGDDADFHAAGVWAALPIVTAPMLLHEALADAERLLEAAALRLGYILQIKL
jgi:glycerate kinase